jgi:CubicO group peptidase (beta-lactamase class C family)
MKKLLTVFLFCFFVFSSSFSQNKFITDSLDNYINYAIKLWNIPGAAVVIVKDGKIVVAKGFGVKEINSNDNVDENTLFMIASNTKAFTATALCLLENNKQIYLNDKVVKWMPDFRLYDSVITPYVTIRDLLCHRLGLQTFQGDFVNWSSTLSRKDIIYNFRNLIPVFDFRTRYGYCNAAFLTAGEIIPLVTGKSWENFVTENILNPLNMQRTSLDGTIMNRDLNKTKGHSLDIDKMVVVPYDEVNNLGPAASMCTSAKDIANWLLMQTDSGKFNGSQVIPYKVLANTITPNITLGLNQNYLYKNIKHIRTYALGWQVEDYNNRLLVSHTGGVNGYVTSTCFLPEEKLGIAVFTNTDVNYLYEALKYQIIESYLNLPYRNFSNIFYGYYKESETENKKFYDDEMKIVNQNNKTDFNLNDYAGKYFNKAYGNIEIKNEEGKLKIHFSKHPFLIGSLYPRKNNSFLCIYSHPGWGIKVIEFKAKDGTISEVKIKVNDNIDFMDYDFTKIE